MIKENVKKIKLDIGSAALAAVTKSRSIEDIREAIDAGISIIAESRVQEAEIKYRALKDFFAEKGIEFHLIGPLQRNKLKKAVRMFELIQSVDSVKLAAEINENARKMNKTQNILMQVNIGKENQKKGVMPENAIEFVNELKHFENIKLKGMMCIAPYFENPENARQYFREMKSIFDKSGLEILSMGMSNDYKVAVEEGSNMVRIGRAIFGERIK